MSKMSEVPAWKRAQKWGDVDIALETFRSLHAELEQNKDNPEGVKEVLDKIKQTQIRIDNSLS
ncbi:MAG: hypothetical protein WAZ50_03020 [Minisyncoccia bacterium]